MHNDATNYKDEAKDMPDERRIKWTDKNDLIAYQEPIRGYWVLKTEIGQLPDDLKGSYTTFKHAEEGVKAYLLKRDYHANVRESKAVSQRLEHQEFLKRRRTRKANGS